jgi:glucose dehydrogenase
MRAPNTARFESDRSVVQQRDLVGNGSKVIKHDAELSGEYSLTVTAIDSVSEPQNWLSMNGDYRSQRYSRLPQINRDNVKEL